jgi:adenylosuccinate synthase
MKSGKFNVVTDGQFGSCGKGLIASALAYKYRPQMLSTTNLPNAGHTAVFIDGRKFIAKAIPSPAMLNRWLSDYSPHILIGASAAFHLERMLEEIKECGITNMTIHERAGVVTDEHKQAESSGQSNTKHIASTMQGGGAFLADKIMRKPGLRLARDYPELSMYMPERRLSLPEVLHEAMATHGHTVLHEGSQGYSLDINHGQSYPQCTSRQTTAIQNMADMGVCPNDLGDVYLVIRPFPIRVGNLIENGQQIGHSGGCYSDQEEISWDEVAAKAGMPPAEAEALKQKELTTVTKRLRRVFTFSKSQLREAALVNGATKIALNFANYIDWRISGVNDPEALTGAVREFIYEVEAITGIPVSMVGTGPQVNHICWRD